MIEIGGVSYESLRISGGLVDNRTYGSGYQLLENAEGKRFFAETKFGLRTDVMHERTKILEELDATDERYDPAGEYWTCGKSPYIHLDRGRDQGMTYFYPSEVSADGKWIRLFRAEGPWKVENILARHASSLVQA